VRSVLARPQAAVGSRSSALWSRNKRTVHPDELVDEIVHALLVWAMGAIGTLATLEILSEHLLKIPMELLSALILGKVLLVVLDKFLDLILELFLGHLPRKMLVEVRPAGAEDGPSPRGSRLSVVAGRSSMPWTVCLLMSGSCVGLLVEPV
jgi:hypothetical protein